MHLQFDAGVGRYAVALCASVSRHRRTPQEKPEKRPLVHRRPEGTSRELPNGRGFLRALDGGNAPSSGPAPVAPPPAAPAASEPAAADATGQLDLLSWRPRSRPLPPPGTQLDLFPGDTK